MLPRKAPPVSVLGVQNCNPLVSHKAQSLLRAHQLSRLGLFEILKRHRDALIQRDAR